MNLRPRDVKELSDVTKQLGVYLDANKAGVIGPNHMPYRPIPLAEIPGRKVQRAAFDLNRLVRGPQGRVLDGQMGAVAVYFNKDNGQFEALVAFDYKEAVLTPKQHLLIPQVVETANYTGTDDASRKEFFKGVVGGAIFSVITLGVPEQPAATLDLAQV